MAEFVFRLPFPPSVNHIWIHARHGGVFLSKKASLYRENVGMEILLARSQGILPKRTLTGSLALSLTFQPPDKRIRDLDNYHKALWDALTHAGVWTDDSQIDVLEARKVPCTGKKEACVEVTIREL